ncbi:MAG: GIY-YIG nuclease family protein [SAR202 cluster bacterium]|nr:GIY-YIG nuclease family protein [SAR202 cluster bacterium]
MFFAYVLQSQRNGRYYIGSTENVAQRLARHNQGLVKSTRSWRPWAVVHVEEFGNLAEARRREYQIKAWKHPGYMRQALGL